MFLQELTKSLINQTTKKLDEEKIFIAVKNIFLYKII